MDAGVWLERLGTLRSRLHPLHAHGCRKDVSDEAALSRYASPQYAPHGEAAEWLYVI